MGSTTLEELLATRPERVQRAVKRESVKLEAKLLLKHDEHEAEALLNNLSHARRELVVAEMAKLKAKRQAQLAKKQSKAASTVATPTNTPTNTSDTLASPPVPLSTKSK